MTDGQEYIVITEWRSEFFFGLKQQDLILIENAFVLEENTDQYFFKKNTNLLGLSLNKLTKIKKLNTDNLFLNKTK